MVPTRACRARLLTTVCWHAEWPTIAAAVQTTGSALAAMVEVVGGLSVDVDQMRANIESSNGAIFAERVTMLLIPSVGRETATRFVIEALSVSRKSGKTFRDALLGMPDITRVIPADQLRTIDDPEGYLGVAEALRVRLLNREP